jgi:hypothetical protein
MDKNKSHIDDFQVKALDKLANSGIIHTIYPMLDRIEVDVVNLDYASPSPTLPWGTKAIINLKIIINDSTINRTNIWDTEFDPFYLVDKYFRELLPYIGIDNNTTAIRFEVYSPDGKLVYEG